MYISTMENKKRYFFKPYVGGSYKKGLFNGKKVMILGASFYCIDKDCKFYEACTSPYTRRTKEFEKLCPDYPISEHPEHELSEDGARSYNKFYKFMAQYLENRGVGDIPDFDTFWDKVTFTNYVQYMIGNRTTTLQSDVSADDLVAFCDVIDEFEPDIVFVWGCVVNRPIKYKESDEDDPNFNNDFDGSEYRHDLFHWQFHGRKITFLNCYHPSYGKFSNAEEQEKMFKCIDEAFGE